MLSWEGLPVGPGHVTQTNLGGLGPSTHGTCPFNDDCALISQSITQFEHDMLRRDYFVIDLPLRTFGVRDLRDGLASILEPLSDVGPADWGCHYLGNGDLA